MVEVLTGALLDPAVGPEVADFFGDGLDRAQDVSHLVVAIDPGAFGDRDAFAARMGRLVTAIRHAGEPGASRLPGERATTHAKAAGGMLELGDDLVSTLGDLAAQLDRPPIVSRS